MVTTRLKRLQQRRRIVQLSVSTVAIFIIICLGIFVSRVFGFYNRIHTLAKTPGTHKQQEKDEYTILLLGYGGGNHEGTYLTDTIMAVNVNLKTKRIVLVSIPRDIWVQVPTQKNKEDFHAKINSVYQMGLFPDDYPAVESSLITKNNPSGLIKKVMQTITGLPVDAFVAVDFEGFTRVIDILGGVDLKVDTAFTDYEYPIEGKEDDNCDKKDKDLEDALKQATDEPVLAFPCRYETLTFTTGETHMDGETALKFARSRHALEDGGDFNRAQRQQKVLEAVKEKVLSIGFIPKIIPLLDELEQHIITDLDLALINKFLLQASSASDYKIESLVISGDLLTDGYSDAGQYIIIPQAGEDDWSGIKKKIHNVRLGITPTPIPSHKLSPTDDIRE